MNCIKFSHYYKKLEKIDILNSVKLLQVFKSSLNDLSPSFLEYDTRYSYLGIRRRYHLKEGEYIVLIFMDSKDNLFTTIRPYNLEKYLYYVKYIGTSFILSIIEKGDE